MNCGNCSAGLYPTPEGFEDTFGKAARNCETCTDSLLCADCAEKNPKCSHCIDLEETPCAKCKTPVGPKFRDLGLTERDGKYYVTGPTQLVCADCGPCVAGCEECRVGAA